MQEKNRLLAAYQRLNYKKNVENKNVGTNEDFLNVNDYSILTRIQTNAKLDKKVDNEQDDDKMEHDGYEMEEDSDEMVEQNSDNPIYCSICKEIFSEPRSLADHIIKEHCSKVVIRLIGDTCITIYD